MNNRYSANTIDLPDMISRVRQNQIKFSSIKHFSGRSILKGGLLVDPKNQIQGVRDIAFLDKHIVAISGEIKPEHGDAVYILDGLHVWPGLVDMHLHLGDLFEVTTNPIFAGVADGVTVGLSPGAGNTFMAPALLGAEVDRGIPMNVGVYLGALNVMGTMLDLDELVLLFKGELDKEIAFSKMTRNPITYLTAPLIIGIKDHIGHWLISNDHLENIFELTKRAGLVFMSHTQDPDHAEKLAALSNGRYFHLAHATAAGCGTHADPIEGMSRIIELVKQAHISAEFVTSMLRKGGGNREGLIMPVKAQEVAYQALEQGFVNVLISDGQGDATMKGFGDSRDNVPCIFELVEMGILPLLKAVATMTANPVRLLGKLTQESWWVDKLGNLGIGAYANITVVDPNTKRAIYTFVNGQLAAFENRIVRKANGAGEWICKFGVIPRLGIGDISAYKIFC